MSCSLCVLQLQPEVPSNADLEHDVAVLVFAMIQYWVGFCVCLFVLCVLCVTFEQ